MIHCYKLFILIVFGSLSHVVSKAQSPESFATLETRLGQARQLLDIPGMTVGVARGDRIIWSKGFGLADVAQNKPPIEQTTYHLASLSKTFASFVIMRLVEQGKLKLDDPISKYTDGFGKTVLVRHLLTHTSEGKPYKSFYEPYTGVSSGLISTVADLVPYSTAIDNKQIVSASSQQQILTPSATDNSLWLRLVCAVIRG